jgi:hypothetical protein
MAGDGPVAIVGAHLVNVSLYGMLIHSPLAMVPGAVHRFRLVIGHEQRDIEARVAMCLASGKHRYDVGLEFVGDVDDLRTRLREALDHLPSNS